jgi:hypothetical protein
LQEVENLRAELDAKTGHVTALEAQLDDIAQVGQAALFGLHREMHQAKNFHLNSKKRRSWMTLHGRSRGRSRVDEAALHSAALVCS